MHYMEKGNFSQSFQDLVGKGKTEKTKEVRVLQPQGTTVSSKDAKAKYSWHQRGTEIFNWQGTRDSSRK